MKKNATFATVLCCVLTMTVLTSCSVDDNPAQMVDNGQWTVSEDEMDPSVRPGDDFYMYCNGGYWNSTVVDETQTYLRTIFKQEIPDMIAARMATLSFPTHDKLMADAAKDDTEEIIRELNAVQSRINALTSTEEAWQLLAELIKEGYASELGLFYLSHNGHMGLSLVGIGFEYDNLLTGTDKESFQWRLLNDPSALACLQPLNRAGSTRAYNQDKWPMLNVVFTELGVDLDNAYSVEFPGLFIPELYDIVIDEMLELQSADVETWKDFLRNGVLADTILLDTSKRADIAELMADKYLKYQKSYIYASAYVTPQMKQRTMDYCSELRKTFHQRIADNEWMSEESKQAAIEKLDAMAFNIGCPDEWIMDAMPDLGTEKTFYGDIRALRRANVALQTAMAGMKTSTASWHAIILLSDLTVMNAFYLSSFNAMNIFPAWMTEPLYDEQQNDALNYATLMTFGHEITHGFDTNGTNYNKFGDPVSLWANEADAQEFQLRAQQLIECYNNFEVMPWALPGLFADGAYTVSEDIADLGGVLLAYDTYVRHLRESGFQGEQFDLQRKRFFLALARLWQSKYTAKYALWRTTGEGDEPNGKDVHSLFRERINGTVMNTDDWYTLFDIQPGDRLYLAPKDRVRIW